MSLVWLKFSTHGDHQRKQLDLQTAKRSRIGSQRQRTLSRDNFYVFKGCPTLSTFYSQRVNDT